jgi:hypothetical protein
VSLRVPSESRGYSEGDEDAPFDSIRQMLQNDDGPPDFGDEAGFEYWAAFEGAAMDTYDEVSPDPPKNRAFRRPGPA